MSADEITAKPIVRRRKGNYAAIALVAGVVLFLAVMMGAPIVFGPRGDLLCLVVEWVIEIGCCGLFALVCGFILYVAKTPLKWLLVPFFLLFAGGCLYGCWEGGLSAADLVLPFKERQIVIVKTYYEQPQSGRGAVPESGGWHIVTTDGDDYMVRAAGDGRQLHAGAYKVRLSYFKRIVMTAEAGL